VETFDANHFRHSYRNSRRRRRRRDPGLARHAPSPDEALRERFGDEYDRTLEEQGKRAKAEAALQERKERVARLDVRPLDPREREAAITEWREVKAVFVDSPVEAVHHADRLLAAIMKARGYPMADFDGATRT
jgi:hypothetical protein